MSAPAEKRSRSHRNLWCSSSVDWSAAEFEGNFIYIGSSSEVLIAAQLGIFQRLYYTMNDKDSMSMPQHERKLPD